MGEENLMGPVLRTNIKYRKASKKNLKIYMIPCFLVVGKKKSTRKYTGFLAFCSFPFHLLARMCLLAHVLS